MTDHIATELRSQNYSVQEQPVLRELEALDEYIQTQLRSCESRTMIVTHNAYTYFARDYNLTVESLTGISSRAEPSANDINRIIAAVEEHNATHIFTEQGFSQNTANRIAEETGIQTSALHVAIGPEPYIETMKNNADTLREGLRCNQS